MDVEYRYIIDNDRRGEQVAYPKFFSRDGFEFKPIKQDIKITDDITFDVLVKKNKESSKYVEYVMFVEYDYINMITDSIDMTNEKVLKLLYNITEECEEEIWNVLKSEYLINKLY